METSAKVGPILGIPTNSALWSWRGQGGAGWGGGVERTGPGDHGETTGKFRMAEQIAPSLAHGKALWASPERPAQPRTWELARGGGGEGWGAGGGGGGQREHLRGLLNGLRQRDHHSRAESPPPHLRASVHLGPEMLA